MTRPATRMLGRLRTKSLTWLLLGLGSFAAGCSGERPRPGTPPRHLLLVTVEKVRRDHVSALGYERQTTGLLKPGQPIVLDVDYLGNGGVTFANALAPESDDGRSLRALMRGSLSDEVTSTLAEDLAAKGFLTAAFVHRGSLDDAACSPDGLGRGFEKAEFAESDEEMLAAAANWLIETADGERSLFVWLHLGGVRLPFAGEPLSDRFSEQDYDGPVRADEAFFEELRAGRVELSSADRRHLRDLYDGRLSRVTQLLNSFLFLYRNTIAEGDLWGESLIVYLGSSGCELAERDGRIGNSDSLVSAGLHVPLVFWHPASLTGERILDTVVELPDVTAALREYFLVEARGPVTGQSLLALTDSYIEKDFEPRPALGLAQQGGEVVGATVRGERWRLISVGGREELYDLRADPGERHDLAEEMPEVVDEWREILAQRMRALDP